MLQAMPPLEVIPQWADGKVVYRYADPYHCRCVYTCRPDEYSANERLVVQKRTADEQWEAVRDWPWEAWARLGPRRGSWR
jgi:hypothetical protein